MLRQLLILSAMIHSSVWACGSSSELKRDWTSDLTHYDRADHKKEYHQWKLKAEAGDCLYQFYYSKLLFQGLPGSLDKNNIDSFKWAKRAADQGYAPAENNIGIMYANGIGVDKDPKQAIPWFEKAAKKGLAIAQYNYGGAFILGKGIRQDTEKALSWYQKAISQKFLPAYNDLGLAYLNGFGVKQDYKEAAKWFLACAELNNAICQFNIAVRYALGQGVEKDLKLSLQWYTKAANQGNAGAQRELGIIYNKGLGAPIDYSNAYNWYQKAAAQGDAVAENNLGAMYLYGQGREIDYAKALGWFKKAARKNFALGIFNIGYIYAHGLGKEQDLNKAYEWYSKAAKLENTNAEHYLGAMYYTGLGIAKDVDVGISWLEKAAKKNWIESQYLLGLIYREKSSKYYNNTKAAEWLLMAANNGHVPAFNEVGVMYETGAFFDKNYSKAVHWYTKAAEQGDAPAQNNLGFMYFKGRGIEQDTQKAIYWYKKAADQSHPMAQHNLGYLYEKGLGLAQDYQKAIFWYRKSASQNNYMAQNNLGYIYDRGRGVPIDTQQALYWYQKAADQGYALAQANLAVMYEFGRGVEKNYEKAFYWNYKAAKVDHPVAILNLAYLYRDGKGVKQDIPRAFELTERAYQQKESLKPSELFLLAELYSGNFLPRPFPEKVHELTKMAAEQKHSKAQYQLGLQLYDGKGTDKDKAQAIHWLLKSAKNGYSPAKSMLCSEPNLDESLVDKRTIYQWCKESADQGIATSQFKIGSMYYGGIYLRKDKKEAFKWFTKASKNKHSLANTMLGFYYQDGIAGIDKDINKSFDFFKKAAEQNEPRAELQLFFYYRDGLASTKDNYKAMYYLYQSARHGNKEALSLSKNIDNNIAKSEDMPMLSRDAQYRLAKDQLTRVKGDPGALELATSLFKKSAENGHVEAMSYLAEIYAGVFGGKGQPDEAIRWITKAAEGGSKVAQLQMAQIHMHGHKGYKNSINYKVAEKWILKLHNNGSPQYSNLGYLYTQTTLPNGKKPSTFDPEKGLKYLHEGIEAKNEFSYQQLAIIYQYGTVTEKDSNKAIELYIEASQLATVPIKRAEKYIIKAFDIAIQDKIFDKRFVHYALPIALELAEKGDITSHLLLGKLYGTQEFEDYDEVESDYWLERITDSSVGANLILFRKSLHDPKLSMKDSLRYLEKQIQLVENGAKSDKRSGYKKLKNIDMYHTATDLALSRQKLTLAEQYLRRASMINKNIGNKLKTIQSQVRQANIFSLQGRYKKADALLLNTLEYLQNNNETNALYEAVVALFNSYIHQGRYLDAIELMQSTQERDDYFNPALQKHYRPLIALHVSYAYTLYNKYDLAHHYLNAYEDSSTTLPTAAKTYYTPLYNLLMSAQYTENSEYALADKYITEAKDIAVRKLGVITDKSVEIVNTIAFKAAAKKQYSYALRWLEAILSINLDSKVNLNNSTKSRALINSISDYIEYSKHVDPGEVRYSSFDLIQLVSRLSASESIVTALKRNKKSDKERQLQKKIDDLRIAKRALLKAKYQLSYNDEKGLLSVNSRLDSIDQKLQRLRNNIVDETAALSLTDIKDIQAALHENDALLSMLVSDKRTHLFVITKNSTKEHIDATFTKKDMEYHTNALREALDPRKMASIPFTYTSSAILYDQIIRPVRSELEGIDRLIVVPHGPVVNIPFSVLIASRKPIAVDTLKLHKNDDAFYFRGISSVHLSNPEHEVREAIDAHWLINDFALTILPSIASYTHLVQAKASENELPENFLGIGNPVLQGTSTNINQQLLASSADLRGNLAASSLALLSPLPETAAELNHEARHFPTSTVLLGQDATEASLRNMKLRDYDVISFATHALVAGELPSVIEPSIVLTPVNHILPESDGLLTATEIAYLDLNADMVILSACNTAAANEEPTADGLSGLANSFFYAGAKSLFVSYWSVVSTSAVEITSGMFTNWQNQRSYAHRHRASIMHLLSNTQDKQQLHPSYWAPFSVIGLN